jgi:hypothetical protein
VAGRPGGATDDQAEGLPARMGVHGLDLMKHNGTSRYPT